MKEFRTAELDLSWLTDGPDPVRACLVKSPATDVYEGPLALVTDEGGVRAFVIGLDTTEAEGPGIVAVMVNGQVVDFGDDYPVILGIFDALAGKAYGEEVWVAAS